MSKDTVVPSDRKAFEVKTWKTNDFDISKSESYTVSIRGQHEVVIQNVPTFQAASPVDTVYRILAEIVPGMKAIDLTVAKHSWKLTFAEKDQAVKVVGALNGYQISGCKLRAAIQEPNPWSMKFPTAQITAKYEGIFTKAEWTSIQAIKNDILFMLKDHSHGMHSEELLRTLRKTKKDLLHLSFEQWPLGVLRMFAPQVLLAGDKVFLNTHDLEAIKRDEEQHEGLLSPPQEHWEPFLTSTIMNMNHLTTYMQSFLIFFGPQHVIFDLPIRVLIFLLQDSYPRNPSQFAKKLTEHTPMFIIWDDVIYLANEVRHRKALLDSFREDYDDDDSSYSQESGESDSNQENDNV